MSLKFQNKRSILVAILALCLLLLVLLMASGRQVTLPLTGIQSNRQVMPPDPDDWCHKMNLTRLDAEVARAELFLNEGIGKGSVDWKYLRRALKVTDVQINGPKDTY